MDCPDRDRAAEAGRKELNWHEARALRRQVLTLVDKYQGLNGQKSVAAMVLVASGSQQRPRSYLY